MNDNRTLAEFKYYKVIYSGNLYEIYNKITDKVEAYVDVLPQALGQAEAYSNVLASWEEKGILIVSQECCETS